MLKVSKRKITHFYDEKPREVSITHLIHSHFKIEFSLNDEVGALALYANANGSQIELVKVGPNDFSVKTNKQIEFYYRIKMEITNNAHIACLMR